MEKKINKFLIPALIVLLCMNFYFFISMKNMENKLDRLFDSLDDTRRSLSNYIEDISYNISKEMEKGASIVNDFSYKYESFKDGNVEIVLSVSPKSISPDDNIYFSYKTGDSPVKLAEGKSNDGVNYNSTINVSIKDDVKIDLVIEQDNTKKIEKLENIRAIEEKLSGSFYAMESSPFQYKNQSKQIYLKNSIYSLTQYLNNKNEANSLNEVKLIIENNGKIVKTYPMELNLMESDEYCDVYSIDIDEFTLDVDLEDVFKIYITAKDKRGFNIRANIREMTIDKTNNSIPEFKKEEIIIY